MSSKGTRRSVTIGGEAGLSGPHKISQKTERRKSANAQGIKKIEKRNIGQKTKNEDSEQSDKESEEDMEVHLISSRTCNMIQDEGELEADKNSMNLTRRRFQRG